jgi:RimJ/RimL family protein N-acetyltransferase
MFILNGIGLRPIEAGDLEKIREMRNDPSTWMNLTSTDHISAENQETWFYKLGGDKSRNYMAIVDIRTTDLAPAKTWEEGQFLGVVRMDEIDTRNRSARVGLDIIPYLRGMGYGKKSYEALLKWGFNIMGFHRLWLCVLDFNDTARHIYFNAGFKVEGKYRQAIWRNGKWCDYILMSILEDEYRTKNP